MPKFSYLCDGNVANFYHAVKLVTSDWLDDKSGVEASIDDWILMSCFSSARRYSKVYNLPDGQLSPYKEVALLAYFLNQKKPISLKVDLPFLERWKRAPTKIVDKLQGNRAAIVYPYGEEHFAINTYIAYVFCRMEFLSIQDNYISQLTSALKQDALSKTRDSNLIRINNVEKSLLASIKSFSGDPISFVAMMENMIMVNDYEGSDFA